MKPIHKYTDSPWEILAYLLGLIGISGTAFSYLEGETLFRSFYWATITATSVGYGDISPKTEWGMALAMLTAILGLVVLALLIAKIHEAFIHDKDEFSHDEQETIKQTLNRIESKLP